MMLADTGNLNDISTHCDKIGFQITFLFIMMKCDIPQLNWALNYQLNRVYQAYYRHIQSYPYAGQVLSQINSSF